MNNREVGTTKEETAVKFLEKQGVKILARNFRIRGGEIDIIGKDNDYICFIEVKYRADSKVGKPEEAVNRLKQKKISRVSDFYRIKENIDLYTPMRFDVIAIEKDNLNWYKDAFPYCGDAYF